MSMFQSPRFLARLMWVDAACCTAFGLLQLGFAAALEAHTGLPAALLQATGVVLLGCALLAAWMASRQPVHRPWIWLAVVANLGWSVACVLVLLVAGLPLNGWGVAWLLEQAVVMLVLGELQWLSMRRGSTPRPSLA